MAVGPVEAERAANARVTAVVADLMAQLEAANAETQMLETALQEARTQLGISESPASADEQPSQPPLPLPVDRTRPSVAVPERVWVRRSFSVHVFVPVSWRMARAFGLAEIIAAATSAQVCREDTLEPLSACPVCGNVLAEVRAGAREGVGPVLVDGGADPLERYTFDCCQSRCSSSRDHMHTRVLLRIVFGEGEDPVFSTPFSLMSRFLDSAATPPSAVAAAAAPDQHFEDVRTKQVVARVRILQPSGDVTELAAALKAVVSTVEGLVDVQVQQSFDNPSQFLFVLVNCDCSEAAEISLQQIKDACSAPPLSFVAQLESIFPFF